MSFLIITGDNPGTRPIVSGGTPELRRWLQLLGFDPKPVLGKYDGAFENSLYVPSVSCFDAIYFSLLFGQDCVVWGNDLGEVFLLNSDGSANAGRTWDVIIKQHQPEDCWTYFPNVGYVTFQFDWDTTQVIVLPQFVELIQANANSQIETAVELYAAA